MRELSIRETRAALSRLEALLDAEGEVVITKHGRPLARLVPLRGQRQRPSHASFRGSLPPLDVGSEELIRQERDER